MGVHISKYRCVLAGPSDQMAPLQTVFLRIVRLNSITCPFAASKTVLPSIGLDSTILDLNLPYFKFTYCYFRLLYCSLNFLTFCGLILTMAQTVHLMDCYWGGRKWTDGRKFVPEGLVNIIWPSYMTISYDPYHMTHIIWPISYWPYNIDVWWFEL